MDYIEKAKELRKQFGEEAIGLTDAQIKELNVEVKWWNNVLENLKKIPVDINNLILNYLPYKLTVKDIETEEIFEVCGFNYDTNEYLVYTSTGVENYCFDLLKPILKKPEQTFNIEEILLELSDYELVNLKDDYKNFILKLEYNILKTFFNHKIDVFNLIDNGFAISEND